MYADPGGYLADLYQEDRIESKDDERSDECENRSLVQDRRNRTHLGDYLLLRDKRIP